MKPTAVLFECCKMFVTNQLSLGPLNKDLLMCLFRNEVEPATDNIFSQICQNCI